VYWRKEDGTTGKTAIYSWRPTDVRPGEARMGRIYHIDSWEVDEAEYRRAVFHSAFTGRPPSALVSKERMP